MNLSRRHLLALSALAPVRVFAQSTPVPGVPAYETIAVGDIEIGYRITGEGEPLLLVMGLGGTMDDWDPTFVPALAEHYQVITFDNRGIAASSGSGPYPFTQLAVDAVGLVKALGFETVNVFGWSLGAMISLDMAIRHREVVRKVVLHAGDPGGSESIPPPPDILQSLSDASGTPEEMAAREISLLIPPEWVETHREYVDSVFSRSSLPVSSEGFLLQGRAVLERYNQSQALASVRVPTLIIHGTEDLIIPVENAQVLADAIPGSWLIRLPGGHGVHYQVPNEMAAMVDLFLRAEA